MFHICCKDSAKRYIAVVKLLKGWEWHTFMVIKWPGAFGSLDRGSVIQHISVHVRIACTLLAYLELLNIGAWRSASFMRPMVHLNVYHKALASLCTPSSIVRQELQTNAVTVKMGIGRFDKTNRWVDPVPCCRSLVILYHARGGQNTSGKSCHELHRKGSPIQPRIVRPGSSYLIFSIHQLI